MRANSEKFTNQKLFRKIKLNKQPNIKIKYTIQKKPYSEFSEEEIEVKCQNLEKYFIKNLTSILEKESGID